jgi:hypothetical protein
MVMTESDNPLSIESGDLTFEITPALAARVTRMAHRNRELLVGQNTHPDNWGATYWTSPQSDWGWPPVAEVDSKPYEHKAVGQGWELTSSLARIGDRVFRIVKRFSPGPQPQSIDACYSIVNCGNTAFSMASWEIARVFPGGITFFPTGRAELSPIEPHHFLETRKLQGYTIFDHRAFVPGKSLKLHADGERGFLAHITSEHLILKLFWDTLPEQQAPGEGECEIFAQFDGSYVEIEVQGSYARIEPGARHDFSLRTVVVPLPLALDDLAELLSFANEIAVQYGAPPVPVSMELQF